jgi:hypothetical protein
MRVEERKCISATTNRVSVGMKGYDGLNRVVKTTTILYIV